MTEKTKIDLFTPKYEGERFLEHRMPLDMIEDLPVLQEMTIEMAKHLYFEESHKTRLPKNFTQGISFELEQLEKGSTIPRIVLITNGSGLVHEQSIDYFKRASERIILAIQSCNNKEDVLKCLPISVLKFFKQFGKNLKDSEHIEFKPNETIDKAKYTKESRKSLILASSNNNEYPSELTLRGMIAAMDKARKSFEIQLANKQKIKGVFSDPHLEALQMAFNDFEKKQKILLHGNGLFNSVDKLLSIQEIKEIVLLEEFDVPARLEELAQLETGWIDGQSGDALNVEGIRWLINTFDNNFDADSNALPATFPTPNGNIQFEWSLNRIEISIEINLITHQAEYFQVNLNTKKEKIDNLNLNDIADWQKLNKYVSTLKSN